MKKNNTVTLADLAAMMSTMQNDCAKIADVCASLDKRLTALEKGSTVSTKAAKPVAEKPKASTTTTTTTTTTEPKWILDKRCVYSVPNSWISKKARYAFKMQAEENGGTSLSAEQREALVKKTGDKYITCRQFKSEKAAKEFFTKWVG